MDNELWAKCWRDDEIPFHQVSVNRHLQHFWADLHLAHDDRIFVPMCGKSLDIVWLLEQGHSVLGVELSPVAVRAFFRENRIRPTREKHGAFTRWRGGKLDILCGDFFDLTAADLEDVACVYDRASLTALPEDVRVLYASHLRRMLPIASRMMLLTTEDEPDALPAIAEEVTKLYEAGFDITLTHVERILAEDIPGEVGNLVPMDEKVYFLTPKRRVT